VNSRNVHPFLRQWGSEVASRPGPDTQRWLAQISNPKLPESSTEESTVAIAPEACRLLILAGHGLFFPNLVYGRVADKPTSDVRNRRS
jgi:hypothetical protein